MAYTNGVFIPHGDDIGVPDVVGCGILLESEVILRTAVELADADIGHRVVDAVIYYSVAFRVERQVYGLTHLAGLEEGGIALS